MPTMTTVDEQVHQNGKLGEGPLAIQLPAVVIVADPKTTQGLSSALTKTRKFPGVYSANSASQLVELTADLPDGNLVYLFSPKVDIDMEGVELDGIVEQIRTNGHHVMAIGGDPAGERFAGENELPILRPRTNLVREIANAAGIKLPEPKKKPGQQDMQRAKSTGDDLQAGLAWRRAKDNREMRGSKELAPRDGSREHWRGAIEQSRRSGAIQPGHRARGFVISFAARKGGVGKTTLSVNSAAYIGRALAETGKRVVLVDLNVQQSDIGNYIHKHSPNVTDLVRNPNLLSSELIEEVLVYSEKNNFHALIGPGSIKDGNPVQVHMDMYKHILDLLRDRFDYILLDTPVAEHYHEVLRFSLPESNYVVVPLAPARVTLDDISEWLNQITAAKHANGYGIDQRKIGLVLNRAKIDIGMDPQDVEDRLSGWKFIAMFPDSDDWQRAENLGGLIGTNPPKELDAVFKHMLMEATHDPDVVNKTVKKDDGKQEKKFSGKIGWLKKLIS